MITEIRDAAVNLVHELKEAHFATGETCLNPFIIGMRGQSLDPVVHVELVHHMPVQIIQTAWFVAMNFDPDVIAVGHEGYTAKLDISPLTGEPWTGPEMQHAVDHLEALEKGWLMEVVVLHVVNRAGDVCAAKLPFLRSKSAFGQPVVKWEETEVADEDEVNRFTGGFIDALRDGMLMPTSSQLSATSDGTDTERAERDVVAARVLMAEIPCHVLLASSTDDTDRNAVLRRDADVTLRNTNPGMWN